MEQGWLCEFVLITNVRTGRSWLFPCNIWLSLFPPGDGSLSVELYPSDRGLPSGPGSVKVPKDTGKIFEINLCILFVYF